MRTIGITGGVGAGKSQILEYLSKNCTCRILLSDRVAEELEKPGQVCYDRLVALLGDSILTQDGEIDRLKMAQAVFTGEDLLEKVNKIVHPAVEEYIMQQIEAEKKKGVLDFFFVEAALLIECGYKEKLDELWYIYAKDEVRIRRLMESRGYRIEKIQSIMKKQLSEEEFRKNCKEVIDNSGDLEETYRQLDALLSK